MEQYIARELKEDIKYLIKKTTELNEKMDSRMIMSKDKENIKDIKTMYEHKEIIGDYPLNAKPDIRLFDRFDWTAIGIAACGVIFLINILWGI